MIDWSQKFSLALSYREFLSQHATEEQCRRWQAVEEAVQLTPEQRQTLSGFKRSMPVLCLAGAWCGDCVHQCPIFEHFQAASSVLDIRYLDRDVDAELKAELTTCGGARVPTVVFLNEDHQFVHRFGDRTLARYRRLAAEQLGASCPTGLVLPDGDELAAVVQDWLDEFERVHLILRTSPRLREKHGD